eukprot:TRINITY_DN5297_c0_g1_i1.p1 TRINITY_DN5297_c0_g1~~TRINITY_DN5297_c0_g1_i1.p1  ORF type:complete len:1029 (-),score=202.14 TRINITY_DN5297_c0_g1_i1:321-3407(-)
MAASGSDSDGLPPLAGSGSDSDGLPPLVDSSSDNNAHVNPAAPASESSGDDGDDDYFSNIFEQIRAQAQGQHSGRSSAQDWFRRQRLNPEVAQIGQHQALQSAEQLDRLCQQSRLRDAYQGNYSTVMALKREAQASSDPAERFDALNYAMEVLEDLLQAPQVQAEAADSVHMLAGSIYSMAAQSKGLLNDFPKCIDLAELAAKFFEKVRARVGDRLTPQAQRNWIEVVRGCGEAHLQLGHREAARKCAERIAERCGDGQLGSLRSLLHVDSEDSEESSEEEAPAAALQPGVSVRIVGLQGASHLNGSIAKCVELVGSTGRWRVCLDNGDIKAVKPDNLTIVEAGARSEPGCSSKSATAEVKEPQSPQSSVIQGTNRQPLASYDPVEEIKQQAVEEASDAEAKPPNTLSKKNVSASKKAEAEAGVDRKQLEKKQGEPKGLSGGGVKGSLCKRCGLEIFGGKKAQARHQKSECSKRKRTCQDCGKGMTWQQFEKHPEVCRAREISCEVCGGATTPQDLKWHEESECLHRPSSCPSADCKWEGLRLYLEEHLDTCPYKDVFCDHCYECMPQHQMFSHECDFKIAEDCMCCMEPLGGPKVPMLFLNENEDGRVVRSCDHVALCSGCAPVWKKEKGLRQACGFCDAPFTDFVALADWLSGYFYPVVAKDVAKMAASAAEAPAEGRRKKEKRKGVKLCFACLNQTGEDVALHSQIGQGDCAKCRTTAKSLYIYKKQQATAREQPPQPSFEPTSPSPMMPGLASASTSPAAAAMAASGGDVDATWTVVAPAAARPSPPPSSTVASSDALKALADDPVRRLAASSTAAALGPSTTPARRTFPRPPLPKQAETRPGRSFWISPLDIHFTHNNINPKFTQDSNFTQDLSLLDTLRECLGKSGVPKPVERIDVIWHEDKVYVAGTFNRRLCVHRLLAIFFNRKVRVEFVLQSRKEKVFMRGDGQTKLSTECGGNWIEVRYSKESGGPHYVGKQLEADPRWWGYSSSAYACEFDPGVQWPEARKICCDAEIASNPKYVGC